MRLSLYCMAANTNRPALHAVLQFRRRDACHAAPTRILTFMLLFRLNNLSLAFGDQPLLDKVALTIHKGERIGILGQNGAGKSTFMKVLLGTVQPDSGDLWRAEGIKVAYLDQTLPPLADQTIYDYIASGLEGLGDLLRQY